MPKVYGLLNKNKKGKGERELDVRLLYDKLSALLWSTKLEEISLCSSLKTTNPLIVDQRTDGIASINTQNNSIFPNPRTTASIKSRCLLIVYFSNLILYQKAHFSKQYSPTDSEDGFVGLLAASDTIA